MRLTPTSISPLLFASLLSLSGCRFTPQSWATPSEEQPGSAQALAEHQVNPSFLRDYAGNYGGISAVSFLPGQTGLVAFAGFSGGVGLWNLETGRVIWEQNDATPPSVSNPIGPDFGYNLSATSDHIFVADNGAIRVYRARDGARMSTLVAASDTPLYYSSVIPFSDNRHLAAARGGSEARLDIWDLEAARLVANIPLAHPLTQVHRDPKGNRLWLVTFPGRQGSSELQIEILSLEGADAAPPTTRLETVGAAGVEKKPSLQYLRIPRTLWTKCKNAV